MDDSAKPSDNLPEIRGPWVRLSSEMVYESPWLRVRHETVTTPAGEPGLYGVIEMKKIAVGIIAVDTDDHTYLVKQFRYTLNAASWEIPEGGTEGEETPEQCALRELEEEAGVTAARLTPLLKLHTSNCLTDEVAYVYLAEGIAPGTQHLDATEDISVARVPVAQAISWALDGTITDAMSVAGLLALAQRRG